MWRLCRNLTRGRIVTGQGSSCFIVNSSSPLLLPTRYVSSRNTEFRQNQRSRKESDGARMRQPQNYRLKPENSQPTTRTSATEQKTPNINAITLLEASNQMGILLHQLSRLDPLPPVWKTDVSITQSETRHIILEATRKLIRQVGEAVRQRDLNPSNKHGREIPHLLGQSLYIYSQLPNSFKASRDVLAILRMCHLDVQPPHYEYAILAAARESRWKEAAELFRMRTDPDAHGYSPVHISVREPVGLYAIAKDAKLRRMDPAASVMEVVLNMSMVSPTDQDKYVLAAGAALGRSGDYQSLVSYLRSSSESQRFGQPLIAGTMHACILCLQNESALRIYHDLVHVNGGEWQWGGRTSNPICTDLAMRACGGMPGKSELGWSLLQQVKQEGRQVSIEAIQGVISACEWDGRWEDTLSVFLSTLADDTRWIGNGDDLNLNLAQDARRNTGIKKNILGKILASAMRACNGAGEFAIALMCSRLLQLRDNVQIPGLDKGGHCDTVKDNYLPFVLACENSDELLIASMTALCGVHSRDVAIGLYQSFHSRHPDRISIDAEDCYKYARTLPIDERSFLLSKTWESTWRNVHRFTAALPQWNSTSNERAGAEAKPEAKHIWTILGPLMRGLTTVGQPRAAIFLAEHSEGRMSTKTEDKSVFASLFALVKTRSDQPLNFTDTVLAETIRAYHIMGASDQAVQLFGDATDKDIPSGLKLWPKSTNAALATLLDLGEIDSVVELFELFDWSSRDCDSYLTVSKGLAEVKMWTAVVDIFKVAADAGCLTEEGALLAMKAMDIIIREEHVGYGRTDFSSVREIAREISRTVGVKEENWIAEKYWTLKEILSFECLLFLNNWDDVSFGSCERDLAILQFENAKKAGLKPNVDVLLSIGERIGEADLQEDELDRWAMVLSSVVTEAHRTTLVTNPRFIHCTSKAWLALKKEGECIEVATLAVEQGVHLQAETIDILLAVKESHVPIPQQLTLLLEDSEFTEEPVETQTRITRTTPKQ